MSFFISEITFFIYIFLTFSLFLTFILTSYFWCFATTIYGVIRKVCHSRGGGGGFMEKVTKVTQAKGVQGRSKGTSCVPFEYFSASTVWRQFFFLKRYIFRRKKRTAVMDVRPYFRLLSPIAKMMTCLRYNQIKFSGITPCAQIY